MLGSCTVAHFKMGLILFNTLTVCEHQCDGQSTKVSLEALENSKANESRALQIAFL